ncbi:hypothetical protein KRZ98_16705 [Sphingobium sp. AS12]|uniref:hypothetical protein n=1 Tax=Sphingobium sp. AS12 TaxID=2849495 RepID=UPI001C31B54A|nr:hypothetical protein [Sphingobium sp. AS12]MBV2149886.1 hypothetical protein [Sphingobium sp. AS12]
MTFAQEHLEPIDLDIVLTDASTDAAIRPERRAIAALSIGVGANDAFYSVLELEDVLSSIAKGIPGGRARLSTVLGNRCDDYQRAIYYALAGRGATAMIEDLVWLLEVLGARGTVDADHPVKAPISPYVSSQADGPVGVFPEEFALGPSWQTKLD